MSENATPPQYIFPQLIHADIRTGPEMTLFRFDDELKGVRRAKYPQLTKEMNPSRRS